MPDDNFAGTPGGEGGASGPDDAAEAHKKKRPEISPPVPDGKSTAAHGWDTSAGRANGRTGRARRNTGTAQKATETTRETAGAARDSTTTESETAVREQKKRRATQENRGKSPAEILSLGPG